MITWITAHDNAEPFKTMATELWASIAMAGAGTCNIVPVRPNGGHYLIEMYGAMYPIFSQAIQEGPVVILDSDCIVQKPIDHLFEQDFVMAAIYRGSCTIAMGRQSFLGCFMAFHPKYPMVARQLWMSWMARTFDYLDKPLEPAADIRHKINREKGWHVNWFGGQTAYNDILFDAEEKGIPILRLDRREYAAKPDNKDACIVHFKGREKLK